MPEQRQISVPDDDHRAVLSECIDGEPALFSFKSDVAIQDLVGNIQKWAPCDQGDSLKSGDLASQGIPFSLEPMELLLGFITMAPVGLSLTLLLDRLHPRLDLKSCTDSVLEAVGRASIIG